VFCAALPLVVFLEDEDGACGDDVAAVSCGLGEGVLGGELLLDAGGSGLSVRGTAGKQESSGETGREKGAKDNHGVLVTERG
jgi:hypothetical protein